MTRGGWPDPGWADRPGRSRGTLVPASGLYRVQAPPRGSKTRPSIRAAKWLARRGWKHRRPLAPAYAVAVLAPVAAEPWAWTLLLPLALTAEFWPDRWSGDRLKPAWHRSWIAGHLGLYALWGGLGPAVGWAWWWTVPALSAWTVLYWPYLRWAGVARGVTIRPNRMVRFLPALLDPRVCEPLGDSEMVREWRHGDTDSVQMSLRPGVTWRKVASHLEAMAATIKAQPGALTAEPCPDGHHGDVILSHTEIGQASAPTMWRRPTITPEGSLVLLVTPTGQEFRVQAWTPDGLRSWLFIGGPGSGKSSTARLVLTEVVSSGRILVVLADCKDGGSLPRAMRDRVALYLPFGCTPGDVAWRFAVVKALEYLVQARKAGPSGTSWSVHHEGPGILFWFEEFSTFFQGMTPTMARQACEIIYMASREGRSLGIGIAISVQNPRAASFAPRGLGDLGSAIREMIRSNGTTWSGRIKSSVGRQVAAQGEAVDAVPPWPGGANGHTPEGNAAGRSPWLPSSEDRSEIPAGALLIEDLPAVSPWPADLDPDEAAVVVALGRPPAPRSEDGAVSTVKAEQPERSRPVPVTASPTGGNVVPLRGPRPGPAPAARDQAEDTAVRLVEAAAGPVRFGELWPAVMATDGVSRQTAIRAITAAREAGRVVRTNDGYVPPTGPAAS